MKPLAPNTLIQNRYLIVHLIGKGGMGDVYLAVDQRLGSAVALKRTFFADDEALGGAFEREAKILARLRHAVLPKVSDHFTENGEQFLVMEHISGDDLFKRLEVANKPFPLSWVLFWADQLLDALTYLHTNEPPIIHRDIKPQNLKLTDENHIVLLDFGLSKNSTGETQFTNSGSVVGYTPHYAPMEQIRGMGTSPRSDIYGLSATLYQLMSNTVPADALSRADALLNGMEDPIRPVYDVNPEIQPVVSDVILKGMEISQDKRYQSAREMQKALRDAFTEMQNAMSAQTVVFPASAIPKSEEKAAAAVEGGEPVKSPAPIAAGEFDATLKYDPAAHSVLPKPGDDAINAAPVPTDGPADGQGIISGAPMPVAPDSVPTVSNRADNGAQRDQFATVTDSQKAPEKASVSAPVPVADVRPKAKKSSKGLLVIGGLIALFVLLAAAGGGGWFIYQKYYAAPVTVPPATPSITPTPTLTPESVPVANTSNANTETDGIGNSNSLIETPPTVEPVQTPKTVKPTPVKTAPAKTPKPAETHDRLKTEQ